MYYRLYENCDFKLLVQSLEKEVKDISDRKRTLNRKTVAKKIAEIFTTNNNFCTTHIVFAFMTSLRNFLEESPHPLSLMKSLELLNDVIDMSKPIFHVFIHMPDWGIFALEKAALAKMREISNGTPPDHTFDINFDRFNYTYVNTNQLPELQKHLKEMPCSYPQPWMNIQTLVDWKQTLVKFDRDYYKRLKIRNERLEAKNDTIFTSSEGIGYNYENLKHFEQVYEEDLDDTDDCHVGSESDSFNSEFHQVPPNEIKIASSESSPVEIEIGSSKSSPIETEITSSPIDILPTSLEQPSLSFNNQSSDNPSLNMYRMQYFDPEDNINHSVYLQADNFSNQYQSSLPSTQSPQIPENSATSQNPKDSILAEFNEGKEVLLQRMKDKLKSASVLKTKNKQRKSINAARYGREINLKRV